MIPKDNPFNLFEGLTLPQMRGSNHEAVAAQITEAVSQRWWPALIKPDRQALDCLNFG